MENMDRMLLFFFMGSAASRGYSSPSGMAFDGVYGQAKQKKKKLGQSTPSSLLCCSGSVKMWVFEWGYQYVLMG